MEPLGAPRVVSYRPVGGPIGGRPRADRCRHPRVRRVGGAAHRTRRPSPPRPLVVTDAEEDRTPRWDHPTGRPCTRAVTARGRRAGFGVRVPYACPVRRDLADTLMPRSRRHLPDIVAVPLWIVVLALAMLAVLRIVAWDETSVLAILNSVTIAVYLPAWLVAAVAAIFRRWLLAVVALLVVVAQLAFLAPELTAAQPLPTWTAKASTFELLDANVYNLNPSMTGYERQIRKLHPQLVTFEESTTSDVAHLRESGALSGLPNQFEVPGYSPFTYLIASRFPLRATHVVWLYGNALVVETVLVLPSGPQPLWVLHTIAPLPQSFGQWQGQLIRIRQLVSAHGIGGLLIAGDFNSTWNNKGFRQLLDTGLIDAGAARGHALSMTWSQMMPPLPPFSRIDHLLTGPGVAITRISTQDGPGSDHRDLLATVATR